MFGIFPEGEARKENDELVIPARIIVGKFTEPLHIPISYWTFEDYKKNWVLSLNEGINTKTHSVLAVSMYEPYFTNFIFTWVIYFDNEDAYIQNKILFLDECHNFTPENINKFISVREIYSEDNMKISEWRTDLNSVLKFLDSIR